MNNSQLRRIGVTDFCIKSALAAVQVLAKQRGVRGGAMKERMRAVLAAPEDFVEDADLGEFARDIIEDRDFTRPEPIEYRTWG